MPTKDHTIGAGAASVSFYTTNAGKQRKKKKEKQRENRSRTKYRNAQITEIVLEDEQTKKDFEDLCNEK